MTDGHGHGIAADLYQKITAPENTSKAIDAMKVFLRDDNEAAFSEAVALYVASARYRQEPIESVAGTLCTLCENLEGPRKTAENLTAPSRMHELLFTGVLKAFYGVVAVERASGARAQRKADAAQHAERGTWPRRPAD